MRVWDAGHRWWLTGTLAAALAAAVVYWASLDELTGFRSGSIVGLWFGIVGTGLMIFAGMLSVRRSRPASPWGSLRWWLRAHIWLGLLSAVLIACHAGFAWGGPVEFALCAAIAIVIASGVWGWCAQEVLPRLLTMEAPLESFREQHEYQCRWLQFAGDRDIARLCRRSLEVDPQPLLPFVREFLRRRESDKSWQLPKKLDDKKAALLRETYVPATAQALVDAAGYKISATARPAPAPAGATPDSAASVDGLQQFYLQKVRPLLEPRSPIRGPLSSPDLVDDEFHRLRLKLSESSLAADIQPVLQDLQQACHVRLQFARQVRLHNWLHGWLLIHIPASIAAALLLLAHIVTALRVIPPY